MHELKLAVKVDLQYLRQGHSNGGDRTHCCCVTPLLRGTGCDQRERRLESAVHKVSAHNPVIHVSSRERSCSCQWWQEARADKMQENS